jgi:tRNA-dihydrouridine synthase A
MKQELPLFSAHKLCVAPMLDWSDRHCRYFHRLLTSNVVLYTEMVTTGALLNGDVERHRQAPKRPFCTRSLGQPTFKLTSS